MSGKIWKILVFNPQYLFGMLSIWKYTQGQWHSIECEILRWKCIFVYFSKHFGLGLVVSKISKWDKNSKTIEDFACHEIILFQFCLFTFLKFWMFIGWVNIFVFVIKKFSYQNFGKESTPDLLATPLIIYTFYARLKFINSIDLNDIL